jgi:hypothetical protein
MNSTSFLLALVFAALFASCGSATPSEDCFAAPLQEQMPRVLATTGVPGAVV